MRAKFYCADEFSRCADEIFSVRAKIYCAGDFLLVVRTKNSKNASSVAENLQKRSIKCAGGQICAFFNHVTRFGGQKLVVAYYTWSAKNKSKEMLKCEEGLEMKFVWSGLLHSRQ